MRVLNPARSAAILVVVLLTTACAYKNPAAPTLPPEDNLGTPTALTLSGTPAAGGTTLVTARVHNLNGAPLGNMVAVFSTTVGTLSPDVVTTGADGTASTTLRATDTARVSVSVGPVQTSTLIAAPSGTGGQTPTPPTTPTAGVFLNVQSAATTGDPVSFGVSSSAIGTIWNWSFGDGATDQTTAFSTVHVFGRAGVYVASVSGAGTGTGSATITVSDKKVAPAPPTPAALAITLTCPKSTTLVQNCNVSAIASGSALPSNAITKVSWDWGDGSTDLTLAPSAPINSHTFAHPGTFVVFATASVSDSSLTPATTSTTVTVPSS